MAEAARARGVETLTEFFGLELARQLVAEGRAADLVIGNNVLAQVPDLNDFVAGIAHLLKPDGVVTLEFPHVVRLIEENQFDTIYHEHFSYFSAGTIGRIADAHGLHVFDVEELPTHGGSLRVYLRPPGRPARETTPALASLLAREAAGGYDRLDGYTGFAARVETGQARSPGLPHPGHASRASGPSATARPARATRCSTTAASGPTCSTSRSTATRTSTAASRPARTSRSTRRSTSPARAARPTS